MKEHINNAFGDDGYINTPGEEMKVISSRNGNMFHLINEKNCMNTFCGNLCKLICMDEREKMNRRKENFHKETEKRQT